MKQAITLLLVFPFMVFFMFQPYLSDVVHMRGIVFENLTHKYAKLAATEGYFSPTLATKLNSELQALHFDTSRLVVTGTTSSRLSRGSEVKVTLEYPIGVMFILVDWFGTDTPSGNYKYTSLEMSEYIP